MKKHIIHTLIAVLIGLSATAQIDRTKIPSSGPTPEVNLREAKEFKLKNGLTILVATDTKFPVVSWSLNLNNPPAFEGDKAGVQSLTGALLGKETQQSTKDEFAEKVDFLGASVSVTPNGGFGYCLAKYQENVFSLFAEAAFQTKFTQEELDFEKEQLIEGIKSGENSAAAIAGNVKGAVFYGKNHAAGEIVTEETVNNVTLEDVKQFYNERFKPSNGYMLFTGDITVKEVKTLLKKYMKNWESGAVAIPEYPAFEDVSTTEINFVDVPNAVQTELAVMGVSSLKMTDKDYHASLVANYILGGAFGSYLNMNLREKNGYTYGVRSSLGTARWYNSSFGVTTKVRNTVTDSAVVEILKEIKRIKAEPVDIDLLVNAKAKFLGNFILQSEDKTVAARRALSIKTNKLPEDFYKNYIANIDAVTIEDVQRVAIKYFSDENVRIVLVGKGSDVVENLEKIEWNGKKLPIKFFDKDANSVEKPVFSKPIPSGVTAATVIEGYIKAIGGLEAVNAVTSVMTSANVTIEGMPFKPTAVMKTMSPNMSSMEMSIAGMGTVMKQKFNGSEGYAEQQGMKNPMSETELSEKAEEKGLFPETYLDASTINLVSLIAIEGVDVYKIKLKEDSFRYYDATTGLLVRTEKTEEAQGQKVTSVQDLSDYREVNGVLFPFGQKITAGPQVIGLSATEITINEGVSTDDFN
jgi:predicted Zn-dependent peptidase|tara:strand:+ start:1439 stop:3520 length:2082 start_codon:yes stop_codon:yes gene_type:complete